MGYPPEVWMAIRRVWELAPKTMSWPVILSEVAESLGCDVPLPQVVSRKCKREKWSKVVLKKIKAGGSEVVASNHFATTESTAENLIHSDDYLQSATTENNERRTGLQVVMPLSEKAQRLMHKTESDLTRKITALRAQGHNLFLMNEQIFLGLHGLDVADVPHEVEMLQLKSAQIAYLADSAKLVETMSKIHATAVGGFCTLHALSPDDFKDTSQQTAELLHVFNEFDVRTKAKMHEITEGAKAAFMRDVEAFSIEELSDRQHDILGDNLADDTDEMEDDD